MKENAIKDFLSMIERSWTYNRMTDSEKAVLRRWIDEWKSNFTGTYKQRWNTLNMIYSFYLAGLGYTGGVSWRE